MRGDLSARYGELDTNFAGVLFQQGRVFLDRDGNAQTELTLDWQDAAGRDVIGPDLAAVPAEEPDGFRIEQAELAAGKVTLTVGPGRIWAGGWLARLEATPPIRRVARYLQPPIQDPASDETTIADGVRDAVVLELWREEVSGFQLPDTLIEPALGGVDTTERIATGFDFRLYRMGEGDTCESIAAALADDFSAKGTLRVTLQPTTVTAGDCPVVEGGGYTGFEHDLYRIEIAETAAAQAMFKWSQYNGGLVGRGVFDAANHQVVIAANLNAITTSGLTDFYLEAVERDDELGSWHVTYGAPVTLNGDVLVLPNVATVGAIPAGGAAVFFRLWNGIRAIADFPTAANPTELIDGIRLEFSPEAAGAYVAGDHWTFPVRAGEIGNPQVLIDSAAPEGIHYRRVPIAVLDWDGSGDLTPDAGTIEDCRRTFQPLTRRGTCCSFSVGDGKTSHSDFPSIQQAVDHLPPEGGEICVLPGTYLENVLIDRRVGVTISGCGLRSRVASPTPGEGVTAKPVIHIRNSQSVRVERLDIQADDAAIGVLVEADQRGSPDGIVFISVPARVRDVRLAELAVEAAQRSGIEVLGVAEVAIRDCVISMRDQAGTWPGIFFIGQDGQIEGNLVRVVTGRRVISEGTPVAAQAGLGGIQLGGGCARVRVVDNLIQGGVGNGITLGSASVVDDQGQDTGGLFGWVVNADDPCNPCAPGDTWIDGSGGDGGTRFVSAGPLQDICIDRNRILDMGLNGIGVIGFFDLQAAREVITVDGLTIVENQIRRCLRRALAPLNDRMVNSMGYGGIALADVIMLDIRENIIEDNGPNYLEPACGIFVLHAEGAEIVHNRIRNNGANTGQSPLEAKRGPRGGIYIALCMRFRASSGGDWPALRVHDNVVSAPLGRALTATALGPVSVQANFLASLGVGVRESAGLLTVPAAVRIVDLASSPPFGKGLFAHMDIARGVFAGNLAAAGVARSSLTWRGSPERFSMAGDDGRVLFTDNQVTLQVAEERSPRAFCSVGIFSLDDVGIDANQCSIDLQSGLVVVNLVAFGTSLRVSDNRLSEGQPNAVLSGVTLGLMNMTTDNQATHCLLVRGWAGANLVVDQPNTVLENALSDGMCDQYATVLEKFGTASFKG